MENERLLKIDEVADRLQVHRSYVYTLISKGVLPKPLKLGKASRIRAAELDAAIRNLAGVAC